MKKTLTLLAVTPLMLAIVGMPAMAQQEAKSEKTNAPTITVFVNNDRVKEPLNNYGVWKGVGFSRSF